MNVSSQCCGTQRPPGAPSRWKCIILQGMIQVDTLALTVFCGACCASLNCQHWCRHCGKSCETGTATDWPQKVVHRFKHVQTVLATEHVWQCDVALDLLEMHSDTVASPDSGLAAALGIIMPLKVFFCAVADICSNWVRGYRALLFI